MPNISAKHIEFIRLVASGSTQSDAYKVSFGKENVSQGYAEKEGCVLAKKYALEIQEQKQKDADIVTATKDSEQAKNALKEVLMVSEVDAQLCKVIKGEEFEVKRMNGQGKVWKAKITPEASDILKAIQLYYNRFGSNAATKIDQKVTGFINVAPTKEEAAAIAAAIKEDL